jgi:Family of unknown function (DUF6527)
MKAVAIQFVVKILDDTKMEPAPEGGVRRPDLAPGSAQWMKDTAGRHSTLMFICPCGCGDIGATPVVPSNPKGWNWDGNVEAPTLTPSILFTSRCRWHGYLVKGIFTPC